jgi:hypothetical protein
MIIRFAQVSVFSHMSNPLPNGAKDVAFFLKWCPYLTIEPQKSNLKNSTPTNPGLALGHREKNTTKKGEH